MLSWAGESREIERRKSTDLSVKEFTEKYLEKSIPVIVEGAFDELDCKKWNFDYLKEAIGTDQVQCRGKTDLETYRKGTKYCIHETTVNEYIDDLLENNKRSKRNRMQYLIHFHIIYKIVKKSIFWRSEKKI